MLILAEEPEGILREGGGTAAMMMNINKIDNEKIPKTDKKGVLNVEEVNCKDTAEIFCSPSSIYIITSW